jgi:hypothetical protein
MATQQGFLYETNVVKFLKKKKLVESSFVPAYAKSDVPDLVIKSNGTAVNVELKISAASGGSLVLKYDLSKKEWSFGDISPENEEKMFLANLATEVGALREINKQWKLMPLKTDPQRTAVKPNYDVDRKKFREIRKSIPATNMEDYYNKKKTYYLNIGSHGFFLLGGADPNRLNARLKKAGMKPIPRFGTSATLDYRVRVQPKSTGGKTYQFTFELSFRIPVNSKSPYNIAPLSGKKGDVTVLENNFSNPFI